MTSQLTRISVLAVMTITLALTVAMGQSDSLGHQRNFQQADSLIRLYYDGPTKNRPLADSLLREALAQSKAFFGEKSPQHASFLSLSGQILLRKGLLKESVQVLEATRILYRQFPTDSNRIPCLTYLARAYGTIGPLKQAQDAILEAEEAMALPVSWSKMLPQALIWDAQAKIHIKLADFNQALSYQQKAVNYFLQLDGIFRERYYPEAATDLASALTFAQRDQDALFQLSQVKDFLSSHKRPDDPVFWKIYITEGQISARQKDYDRAEDSFLRALLIVNRQRSSDSPWSVMTYSLLGSFYQTSRKNPDQAAYYYALSQSALKKSGMTIDFMTARALNDLASLHMQKGQFQQAATELAESQRLIRIEQASNFGFTAVRQKELDANFNQQPFLSALSFTAYLAKRGEKQDTLFRQLSYNAALYLNGLLVNDARQIRRTILNSGDTTIRQLYTRWSTLKQDSITAGNLSPSRINELKQATDLLEQQMARQSARYTANKRMSPVDWQQISQRLQPTEAAITFVRFPGFNPGSTTASADSILYAALLVRSKQTAPDMVVLCSEQQLLATLNRRGQAAPAYVSRGTVLGGKQRSAAAGDLYRLIWQPLERVLPGIKRIYYSPGGLLHGVSFAGLPLPAGKSSPARYLTDHYELRQLFSTRDVATGIRPLGPVADASALLVGGVKYGASGAGQFDALPGSRQEVFNIHKLLPKAILLSDTLASEARIKALSGSSPTILHLATHGFYQATATPIDSASGHSSNQPKAPVESDPLQRSGLALAGVNGPRWENRLTAVANDGILTAYEVAILDLSQTRLVVLSACETALGDVPGAEGVYGLQRAFRLAGADKLIVSLRAIPDQVTQQLMSSFYGYLQKGADVHNALRQAQYRLRQRYPDPAVWAAFVLIE